MSDHPDDLLSGEGGGTSFIIRGEGLPTFPPRLALKGLLHDGRRRMTDWGCSIADPWLEGSGWHPFMLKGASHGQPLLFGVNLSTDDTACLWLK